MMQFASELPDSPPSGRAELLWTNLPASWGVFVLLAVLAAMLYAVFSIYRREMESCPPWAKTVLAVLRSLVVLLLVFIFLGPAVVDWQTRTIHPTIVLARDASQSMNTADRDTDPATARATRADIVNDLLDRDRTRLIDDLTRKGRLHIIDFAEQATRVDVGPRLPPLVADGRGTDLSSAVRQSLAVDRPAAVVLFTDGQHTASDDPLAAAREAKSRGVPIFVVGIGDPTRRSNVSIANVYARPQAWQEEPFEIDAVIRFESAAATGVRVELVEQRLADDGQPSANETVVQTTQVAAPESGTGQQTIRFSQTVRDPGRYIYRVRTAPTAGESDESDNVSHSNVVKVLNRDQIRVLLVAGAPTWDYRLVQKLLARDKSIRLSCWLQTLDEDRAQEGTQPITHLPSTKEELFEYDVVLLFDPNPQEIDAPWIELLKEFVGEHAGGLLFMAGPKHSSQLLANPRTAPISNLLPVTFGDTGALEVSALLATHQRPWPLKLVPANADNPVLRFYAGPEESQRRWESLPGILWSFPAQDARPAAQVLIEHSDVSLATAAAPRPLLVSGRYGSGHTLYLGFTGTWRWRNAGRQAEFFDKFWIQAIRYLTEGRSLEGHRRGRIETDRDRYEVGQRATITARLEDASYDPLKSQKIDAAIVTAGQEPEIVSLLPVASQPGTYQATFTARRTGVHGVHVTLPGSEAIPGRLESSFVVELPSVETNQVWLNRPLLKDLASLSGGRYFDANQIDQLAAAIPDRLETIETRSPPRPLWDVRGMLVALVGLLCLEWLIRKRYRLL